MSLPPCASDVTDAEGFILAGGRSTRMGQDKALIPLAGEPLIQLAVAKLRESGIHARIAGARSDLSAFAPIIPDDIAQADRGPLSGVCSALSETQARFALFLPVDLPLIPSSLLSYLLYSALVTDSAFTLCSIAGFVQTFPVVVDRAALSALRQSLVQGRYRCLEAFQNAAKSIGSRFAVLPVELLVQAGQILYSPPMPPTLWFLNINTAADLARAESLVRCPPVGVIAQPSSL